MKKSNLAAILVLVLSVTFFTGTVWGKAKPADNLAAPEVKYSHFGLKNGLQIYVFEDHQVPLVEVTLWYKVGSLNEPEGNTGISHLLEHTMFLGTETLQKDQVHQLIKQVGGDNNASTSTYYTEYHEKIPAANLELALAIEADRMRNLKINPEEFRREKEVVMQERRRGIESNAISSAYEAIKAAAFTKSPLHHEVIGWMNDINAMTVEKLQDYYRRYYSPNNAILTVTGAASPEQVLKLAEKYFGAYHPAETAPTLPAEPEQKEERKLVIEKLTNVPYMIMLYQLPGGTHPDMVPVDFLLDILVNRSNSRINQELKQNQEVILGAGASVNYLPVQGFAQIVLVPVAEDKIATVEAGFDSELTRLIQNGISDEELQIIKKAVLKDLIFSQRNVTNFASRIIFGCLQGNDPEYYKQQIKQINAITKEDIVRVAKQYFNKQQRTVGYIIPQKSPADQAKQK